jgi:hypothetical protein
MTVMTVCKQGALAVAIAAALGMTTASPAASDPHPLDTIVVTNCADNGTGSFRDAVASASAGSTIDLSGLTCSTITLTSGAIVTAMPLTLIGPGSTRLAIDGNHTGGVLIEQAPNSALSIKGMTIRNGYVINGSGGCIYSADTVVLDDVVISGCTAGGHGVVPGQHFSGGGIVTKGHFTATGSRIENNQLVVSTAYADGGGLYSVGTVTLTDTVISGNSARMIASFGGNQQEVVHGGGFYGKDATYLTRSSVNNNFVLAAEHAFAVGGGFWTYGLLDIEYSSVSNNHATGPNAYFGGGRSNNCVIYKGTISGNSSDGRFGAFVCDGQLVLNEGTVSGNTANHYGGIYGHDAFIENSTIAFNVSTTDGSCAGLCLGSGAVVDSSIIADNTSGTTTDYNAGVTSSGTGEIDGRNNLIGVSLTMTLPDDTIQADPLLAPLADNGGTTLTHALMAGSPAINSGYLAVHIPWDQRGEGFPRIIDGAPDIGAVEMPVMDQPPTAVDDTYTTDENSSLTVEAPGLLANDTDPDDDALSVVLVDDVISGSLTLGADGSFVYVPTPDFFGTDQFTYEVTDGAMTSNTATVTIEVLEAVDDDFIFADGFEPD